MIGNCLINTDKRPVLRSKRWTIFV